MLDRFKEFLGGSQSGPASGARSGPTQIVDGKPVARQSNGLEQFFTVLRDRQGLSILDFAGASQANISFITSMGHRLASEDFVRAIENTFGDESPFEKQTDPLLMDQFVRDNLSFEADSFDGALVWDAFQHLSPHLLQLAVDRLYETLRPGAYMLAFFHADERARHVPLYSYRIADERTLSLILRGHRQPGQFFNNRAIEKLFHKYQSVKFFLARDSLREIIIRR